MTHHVVFACGPFNFSSIISLHPIPHVLAASPLPGSDAHLQASTLPTCNPLVCSILHTLPKSISSRDCANAAFSGSGARCLSRTPAWDRPCSMTQISRFKTWMSGLSKIGISTRNGHFPETRTYLVRTSHDLLWIDGLVLDLALGERRVQLRTPMGQF